MRLSPKTIFSISYFMLRRNDLISCLTTDKSYLDKKEIVLEALKSFHLLINKFPDDKFVTQEEFDTYFQGALENLSDIGVSELAPNNIDNTINLILDRTKDLTEIISKNFPEIIKENRKEMQLRMTSVGNNVETKANTNNNKHDYNIVHFSGRYNMKNKTLKYFSDKRNGKLKKGLIKNLGIGGAAAATAGLGIAGGKYYIDKDAEYNLKDVSKDLLDVKNLTDSQKINMNNEIDRLNRHYKVHNNRILKELDDNKNALYKLDYDYHKGDVSMTDYPVLLNKIKQKESDLKNEYITTRDHIDKLQHVVNNPNDYKTPVTIKDKLADFLGRYGENDKFGMDNYDKGDTHSIKGLGKSTGLPLKKEGPFGNLIDADLDETVINTIPSLNFCNNKMFKLFHDAEAPLKSKLRADIQDELEAIREYDEHIDTISDETVKAVLTHIRDEEKQHVGELSALVDRVDPPNVDLFEKGYEEAAEMMTKEEYFSLLSDFLSKPKQIEIGSMPFDLNKKGVYEGHYKGMTVVIDRYKKDKEDTYKAIIYGIDTYKNAAVKKVNETKKIESIRDKDKKYLESIVPVELYISQSKGNTYINIILKSRDSKFSYSVLFKNNPFNIENIQILNKN